MTLLAVLLHLKPVAVHELFIINYSTLALLHRLTLVQGRLLCFNKSVSLDSFLRHKLAPSRHHHGAVNFTVQFIHRVNSESK